MLKDKFPPYHRRIYDFFWPQNIHQAREKGLNALTFVVYIISELKRIVGSIVEVFFQDITKRCFNHLRDSKELLDIICWSTTLKK